MNFELLASIAINSSSGDVFARAAFDKRQNIQLVLAKNLGPPTPEVVSAANELISRIWSPTVVDAVDLFPFLIRRCGANIDKRIYNLHTSIRDGELRYDALQTYSPEPDIQAEFPGAETLLGDYEDAVPPESFPHRLGRFLLE